jgi:hypothetical protein
MDSLNVFSRGTGVSFALSFAARLLMSIANAISINQSASDLQELARTVQPKELWAMCLLLVAWWSDQLPPTEAQAVDEAFKAVDTSVVRSGLSMLRDKLALFIRSAYAAQDDLALARAGGGFTYFIGDIGLRRIQSVLSSDAVRSVLTRFLQLYPLDADLERLFAATAQAQPVASPSAPTQPSRGDRFDRFGLRLPPVEPPQLNQRERTIATLHGLGYSEAEIDEFLTRQSQG